MLAFALCRIVRSYGARPIIAERPLSVVSRSGMAGLRPSLIPESSKVNRFCGLCHHSYIDITSPFSDVIIRECRNMCQGTAIPESSRYGLANAH